MMRALGLFTLGTVALSMSAHVAGIRPNFSASAPSGLWISHQITAPLHRGMIVGLCPPSTVAVVQLFSSNGTLPYGECPETHTRLLLKPIAAVEGDTVRIEQGKPATVNGWALPNTSAHKTVVAWPDGEYIVKPNQVWVFSTYHSTSFDSRYFGPVDIKDVHEEAEPLLTTGSTSDMTIGIKS
jgi:conjugative transfer signal peptidase TraF